MFFFSDLLDLLDLLELLDILLKCCTVTNSSISFKIKLKPMLKLHFDSTWSHQLNEFQEQLKQLEVLNEN